MDNEQGIVVYENALAELQAHSLASRVQIKSIIGRESAEEPFPGSDMDGWDFAVCLISAAVSAFITTNDDLTEWFAGVHDVASEKKGDCGSLQKALGALFHHKGDSLDMFSTRGDEDPWRLFHRLFFGHDILSKGGDVMDNPFYLMFHQEGDDGNPLGMQGVLQASRHLVGDTFSKQGLPLPGSSYFDYENENGRPWNYLIDLCQRLSESGYGSKTYAEPIYEHLLTIRAQDIAGGMAAKAITSGYFKIRKLDDSVRVAQVRLLSYTMSFYAQAIVGAVKQKGIPYINAPLGAAMVKECGSLLIASNAHTNKLNKQTMEIHGTTNKAIDRHDRLKALLSDDVDYLLQEPSEDER